MKEPKLADSSVQPAVGLRAVSTNERRVVVSGMAHQLDCLAGDRRQPAREELRVRHRFVVGDSREPLVAEKPQAIEPHRRGVIPGSRGRSA